MDVWVRSEYAEELAVVFAGLSALLPWSISFADFGELGSIFFVRFPLFQVRYSFGMPFFEAVAVLDPYSSLAGRGTTDVVAAIRGTDGITMASGYAIWVLGAVVIALALLLALGMYVEWAPLLELPTVSAMGILLIVGGSMLGVAFLDLFLHGFPGPKIPLGVPFVIGFGIVLLGSKRR